MSARHDFPSNHDFDYDAAMDEIDRLRDERQRFIDCINTKTAEFAAETVRNSALESEAALGREISYEIERFGDPYLMGVAARVSAGDGFTQNSQIEATS